MPLRAAFFLMLACLLPTKSMANMAAPWHPGESLAEPFPELRDITILREDIAIDLTSLAHHAPRSLNYVNDTGVAPIEAIYQIDNAGQGHDVELVFIAPALTSFGSGVWLDGKFIASAVEPIDSLPKPWLVPRGTPVPGDTARTLPYDVNERSGIRFKIYLPSGRHLIAIRYRAEPSAYSSSLSATAFWQLAYVLAPARNWKNLDTLHVVVYYPKGWEFAATPAMTLRGDSVAEMTWTAGSTHPSIPTDAIAITTLQPPPPLWDVKLYPWLILFGLVASTVLFGSWFGKRAARKHYGKRRAIALAPICAIAASAIFFYAYAAVNRIPASRIGIQIAWPRGYGNLLLGSIWMLTVWFATLAAFFLSYRKSRSRNEQLLAHDTSDVIEFPKRN